MVATFGLEKSASVAHRTKASQIGGGRPCAGGGNYDAWIGETTQIDDATRDLPHVDEHALTVAAGPEAVWAALLRTVEASVGAGAAPRLARVLGCADVESAGPRPLASGSILPGFHVAAAVAPSELVLAGSHRFSSYALVFRLDPLDGDRTRLRAETRAEFPHLKGAVYRALVIGTRMHVLVTRRILEAAKRGAER